MTKALTVIGFDYDSVEKETKGKLLAWVREFRAAMKEHASFGLELGKIIDQAHEELSGEGRDGKFAAWVESELNVSRQTAYNYLWAWQRFGKCKTVLHFFDSKALYKLASPKTPDKAVEAAIKRAEDGKSITPDVADSLIKKYKPKPAVGRSSGRNPTATGSQSNGTPPATSETALAHDPIEDEAEEELSFEDRVKLENGKIESFCRQLMKFFEEGCPRTESVDYMGRYDSALAQIRAACSTLRTCKYQDTPCPKCKGQGCATCEKESDFGAVSALTYRQLAG